MTTKELTTTEKLKALIDAHWGVKGETDHTDGVRYYVEDENGDRIIMGYDLDLVISEAYRAMKSFEAYYEANEEEDE